MTPKPPVRPGHLLRYETVLCHACGNPFEVVWRKGKPPKRLCKSCRRG